MIQRYRIWTGLGAALLAGTMLTTTALAAADDNSGTAKSLDSADLKNLQLAANEEGEGGEGGEVGEGGGGDETRYLTNLALMRGHLFIGMELFRQGHIAEAKTHMKHPGDELYGNLTETFEAKGFDGFANELSALAAAVESDRGAAEAQSAYDAVLSKIGEAAMLEQTDQLAQTLDVVFGLARTAADEYDEAVEDNTLVNLHEYQDALGFVAVAKEMVAGLGAEQGETAPEAIETIGAQLDLMEEAFSGTVPDNPDLVEPSVLYGAAARIEIASLSVER